MPPAAGAGPPVLEQLLPDSVAGHRLAFALHRDAHQVRARICAALDLVHGALDVPGVRRGHRLHTRPGSAPGSALAHSAAPGLYTAARRACRAMGCSLPTLTPPMLIVRVGRRVDL